MPPPRIIGITGNANSGKDSIALVFKEHGYTHRAFAWPIRDFVSEVNPIVGYRGSVPLHFNAVIGEHGYDVAKVMYPEIRRVMVSIGQNAKKHFYNDIWMDKTLPLSSKTSTEFVVVSDVRYLDEEERIRAVGGIIIAVLRPGVGPANDHEKMYIPLITERADVHVVNSGSLDTLKFDVNTLVEKWNSDLIGY